MNDVRFPLPEDETHAFDRLSVPRRRNTLQALIVWHRRIGLATALIVIFLAVSGLLLNHSSRLGLDQSQVSANWLLRWYGFPPAPEATSYRAGERWVSWTGARLLLDAAPVLDQPGSAPVGAAALAGGVLAAAFPDSLVLFDGDGALIERIGAESLPGTVQRIGTDAAGMLVLDTASGRFAAGADLIDWTPTGADAAWSGAEPAPAALRERLLQAQRGPGLPAERVLQDLHSGRIFGPWGPWLMDAAAIAFVVMAFTGFVYWWKQRRRTLKYRRRGEHRRRHR